MKFTETLLKGVFVIEQEQLKDNRGYFSRIFCHQTFESHGLHSTVLQTSESFNEKAGTTRGMHYQIAPNEEIKLVRCTKGRLFDAVVDLREDSDTFCQSFTIELSEHDNLLLYIPKGIAHGFQSLDDETIISYYMLAGEYNLESARGYHWNDPKFAIEWPTKINPILSEKDNQLPFLKTKSL